MTNTDEQPTLNVDDDVHDANWLAKLRRQPPAPIRAFLERLRQHDQQQQPQPHKEKPSNGR